MLPENPTDPVLTRMRVPAPYQVPAKGDKAENGKAKGGLPFEGTSGAVSGEIKIPPPEVQGEGEANIPSSHGKKRAASKSWEVRAPKRGKTPLFGRFRLGRCCCRTIPS